MGRNNKGHLTKPILSFSEVVAEQSFVKSLCLQRQKIIAGIAVREILKGTRERKRQCVGR